MSCELSKIISISPQELDKSAEDVAWKKNYLSSANSGNIQAGIEAIEEEISSSGETPELKLWWIHAQLDYGKLPITALSAPLDDLILKINSEDIDYALLSSVSARIADGLINRKQYRLGATVAEKALSLGCSLASVTDSSLHSARKIIINTLNEELREANKRKDSKTYIHQIEVAISKHQDLLKYPPIIKPLVNKTDSPPINQLAINQLEKPTLEKFDSLATTQNVQSLPGDNNSYSPYSLTNITISLLFLSASALGLYYFYGSKNNINPSERLLITLAIPATLSPILPEPAWIFPPQKSESFALDNLGERLNLVANKIKTPENISQEATSAVQAADTNSLNVVDTNLLKSSDVDQRLPKKLDDLVPISGLPYPRNDIPEKKIPSIDPLVVPRVEVLGTNSKSLAVPPIDPNARLSKSSDGRIYGPPQVDDRIDDLPSGRALDGSVMKSYSVEQFNPPLVYKILTKTQVLNAPSLLAEPLAKLEPNTPVFVTAKMGLWLELRSTGGRVGYIYAQDAGPDTAKP